MFERVRELERLLYDAKTEMRPIQQIEQLEYELDRVKKLARDNDINYYDSEIEVDMGPPPKEHPTPLKLAPDNAYRGSGIFCPHCRSSAQNQILVGHIIIDGALRPAYDCQSCNKSWSDIPDSMKTLLDEARKHGATNVGFQAGDSSQPVVTNGTYDYEHQRRHQNEEDRQQMNANALSSMNDNIQQMLYAIQDLTSRLDRVTQQNHELMDKLANDPLVHVRKAVSEFDLK